MNSLEVANVGVFSYDDNNSETRSVLPPAPSPPVATAPPPPTRALPQIAAVPPPTYEPPPSTGCKTPSGNIFCMVPTNEGVRCGIARTNTLPVPGPRDCDLDYGDAFEISETANRGVLVRHGDTVRATASRGLP